jgi:hypothetical protein
MGSVKPIYCREIKQMAFKASGTALNNKKNTLTQREKGRHWKQLS